VGIYRKQKQEEVVNLQRGNAKHEFSFNILSSCSSQTPYLL